MIDFDEYNLEEDIRNAKIYVRADEKYKWDQLKLHHYMSDVLPSGCKFWTFYIKQDNEYILIGGLGVLFQMNKLPAKRITRFVILPEFQGLGFSKRILDMISEYYLLGDYIMYIVTYHPRLGNMLSNSINWVPTINNQKIHKKKTHRVKVKSSSYIREGEAMYRFKYIPTKSPSIKININNSTDKEKINFNEEIHKSIQKEVRSSKEKEILRLIKEEKEKELDKQMAGPLKPLRRKKIKQRKTPEILKKLKELKEKSAKMKPLITKIPKTEITQKVRNIFTIIKDEIIFTPHEKPFNEKFCIGYITGSSGSGKSILLKEYGEEYHYKWDNLPICSNFKSYEQAEHKLLGAGLSSIPAWLLPFHLLSTGQKYRANLAINLKDNSVFDEFTGYLDRNTAKSVATSVSRYVKDHKLTNIVFCGPHKDIIQYLEPDWVYDCDSGKLYNDKTPEIQDKFIFEG